ncbi:MAG: hypothetical protein AB4352_12645 [Hormoscilla sp.]
MTTISKQSSLTSILAAAAIASGALLAAVNPAEACMFSKMKQTSVEGASQTSSTTFNVKDWKSGKWAAIAAAGVATVAGLGAVGITSRRRQDPTDIAEVPEANAETASEYVVETVLTEVTVTEETPATETADRELTLVK